MRKEAIIFTVFIGFVGIPMPLFAEACTYDEALIALENGNLKRAETLMRMAANDGDLRAAKFIRNVQTRELKIISQDNLVVSSIFERKN